MTEVNSHGFDIAKIALNLHVVEVLKAMAYIKLAASGRSLGNEAELLGLATAVSDAYLPSVMARYWSELDAHVKRETRKAGSPAGARVDVHIYEEAVEDYLIQHLGVIVKAGSAAVRFDGVELRAVQPRAKADSGPQPIHVHNHVAPAPVSVQNAGDVHVAGAVVNVPAPVVTVQQPTGPATTEIVYETGPDGRSRPKSITRQGAPQ